MIFSDELEEFTGILKTVTFSPFCTTNSWMIPHSTHSSHSPLVLLLITILAIVFITVIRIGKCLVIIWLSKNMAVLLLCLGENWLLGSRRQGLGQVWGRIPWL